MSFYIVIAVFDTGSSDCYSPKLITFDVHGMVGQDNNIESSLFGLIRRKSSMGKEPLSFRVFLPLPFEKGAHFFHP